MGPRLFFILLFSALAAAVLAAVGAGIWLIQSNLPADTAEGVRNIVIVYGGGVALLLVAAIAVMWAYLDHAMAQPILAMVRGIQTVVHANADYRLEIDEVHLLDRLPSTVNELIRQLGLARSSVSEEIDNATASLAAQKNQLATILRDLHEGVVVCTLNHRILLYNTRALELLRIGGNIGLDRSLFHFLTRQPILHALSRLTNRLAQGRYEGPCGGPTVAFVGSTTDGKHTLEGQLSLMLDAERTLTGYVLSFEDGTEELAALGLRDRLLREATEGLRAPVANLRAAAEILAGTPQLDEEEAWGFKQVLLQESQFLCTRLEALAGDYRDVITGHWPMSDIYSSNLFQNLADRLREQRGVLAGIVGIPQWLNGDSYSLVELLDRLIVRICDDLDVRQVQLEAVAGERGIYLDVVWSGRVLTAGEIESWLGEQVDDVLGGLSLREILERHKTDLWSLPDRPGEARLRLPLPPPVQVPVTNDTRLPPRPEFYDFDLLQRPHEPGGLGELGRHPLRSLTYVVFDTETTGLNPGGGDEIVSIAGVRIVNGRILTGESFERTVNPRRLIPPESIRFHGITDEAVRDMPPIQVVLPQFRAFVGDAVLVAHNAAFDMRFVQLREAECGVRFAMPVLDTMLLSCFLHDYSPRHSLDVVAQRFGIPIQGRHTALGDALVTAGCFLKMLELLDAHGVVTLDEALAACQRTMTAKVRQTSF